MNQDNNIAFDNYTNQNYQNNRVKSDKFKLLVIIGIIIVILFTCIILFNKGNTNKGNTESGTTINQGEVLKIKSNYIDIDLTVESVEKNIKLTDLFGNEEVFTKIKISIINNKNEDFDGYFIAYELFDQNKNLLENNNCLTETWMSMYEVNDAIATKISANETHSGYLYCRDDKNLGKVLGITSFTEFDDELIKQDIIKSTDSDIFYVTLN